MFAIPQDELDKADSLGDFILCDKCGQRHIIEHGSEILDDGTAVPSKLLAFYRCDKKIYLAGIAGKNVSQ